MSITAGQLQFKKGKLGSSQVAAALGVSPFQTRANLFNELKGLITRPDIGEKGIIGNEIEPVIANAYTRRMGIPLEEDHRSYVHPDHPYIISHVDRVAPEHGLIVELKNVGPRMAFHWGEDNDPDGAPMYVTFQCILQAALLNVERVDVCAMFGGGELRIYPLEVSEKAKQGVLDGLVAFWEDHIVPNVQPVVTEDDIDMLRDLYRNCFNEKIIEIDSTESAIMFKDYRDTKDEIKRLTKKSDNYKANIIEYMGDASILMRSGDYEFTYKKSKDKEVVDYQGGYEDLQGFCSRGIEFNGIPGHQFLKMVLAGNTSTKPGSRRFLDKGE